MAFPNPFEDSVGREGTYFAGQPPFNTEFNRVAEEFYEGLLAKDPSFRKKNYGGGIGEAWNEIPEGPWDKIDNPVSSGFDVNDIKYPQDDEMRERLKNPFIQEELKRQHILSPYGGIAAVGPVLPGEPYKSRPGARSIDPTRINQYDNPDKVRELLRKYQAQLPKV